MAVEKFGMYCIFDTVGVKVAPPFCASSQDVAVREFVIGCFGANLPPQDMQLFRVGSFEVDYVEEDAIDEQSGKTVFRRDLANINIRAVDDEYEIIDVTEDDIDRYFSFYQKLRGNENG